MGSIVSISHEWSQKQEGQRETHKGSFAGPSLPAHIVHCICNRRPLLPVLSALFPNAVIKREREMEPYISFTLLHHILVSRQRRFGEVLSISLQGLTLEVRYERNRQEQ